MLKKAARAGFPKTYDIDWKKLKKLKNIELNVVKQFSRI